MRGGAAVRTIYFTVENMVVRGANAVLLTSDPQVAARDGGLGLALAFKIDSLL
jgi:hypothetical protein